MKEYYVYAICNGRPENYLQCEFTGTLQQCKKFIIDKVKANRPTHYNFISCLSINKASKRYL